MVNILVYGCYGKLGRLICDTAAAQDGFNITAGIANFARPAKPAYPFFDNIWDCDIPADVIIDCSIAHAVDNALDYAVAKNTPIIICTTALSDDTIANINLAAKKIPVLRSANLSLGTNLLARLVSDAAAALFGKGFDIEIIEQHHKYKVDAPSGTALMLADVINAALPAPHEAHCGRCGRGARKPNEIGIHSIRGGTNCGSHKVLFAGYDEVVEISHSAQSRDVFARGAIAAAAFLAGKPAGIYEMTDIFGN